MVWINPFWDIFSIWLIKVQLAAVLGTTVRDQEGALSV
jgi:hypothetical protein